MMLRVQLVCLRRRTLSTSFLNGIVAFRRQLPLRVQRASRIVIVVIAVDGFVITLS
jgi:hypothetical protein